MASPIIRPRCLQRRLLRTRVSSVSPAFVLQIDEDVHRDSVIKLS